CTQVSTEARDSSQPAVLGLSATTKLRWLHWEGITGHPPLERVLTPTASRRRRRWAVCAGASRSSRTPHWPPRERRRTCRLLPFLRVDIRVAGVRLLGEKRRCRHDLS